MTNSERQPSIVSHQRQDMQGLRVDDSIGTDMEIVWTATSCAFYLTLDEVVCIDPVYKSDRAVHQFLFRHAGEIAHWRRQRDISVGFLNSDLVDFLALRHMARCLECMTVEAKSDILRKLPEALSYCYSDALDKAASEKNRDNVSYVLRQLRATSVDRSSLQRDFDQLDIQRFEPFTEPLEHLLVSGADARLKPDQRTLLMPSGCSLSPRDVDAPFSSSTGSTISKTAFEAVDDARRAWVSTAISKGNECAMVPANAFDQMRDEMQALFGFNHRDNVDIAFAASGTDVEMLVVAVARDFPEQPVTNIVIAPNETGGGVALAAEGRHFSDCAPLSNVIDIKGKNVPGMNAALTQVEVVDIRDDGGIPRPLAEMDRECERRVRDAINADRRCILHVQMASKTGLSAPSLQCATRLSEEYGDELVVVLDACQFRTSPSLLRDRVLSGDLVIVTGSKFFGGPSFSGALLSRGRQIRAWPVGFDAYFAEADLPQAWKIDESPARQLANNGVYFRWRAALVEMRRFFKVPEKDLIRIIGALSERLGQTLCAASIIELVDSSQVETQCAQRWDHLQTIFSFLVKLPETAAYGDFDLLRQIYQDLNRDCSDLREFALNDAGADIASAICHTGQPVRLSDNGHAALRVSISAEIICEAWEQHRHGNLGAYLDSIAARIDLVINKIAWLLIVYKDRERLLADECT